MITILARAYGRLMVRCISITARAMRPRTEPGIAAVERERFETARKTAMEQLGALLSEMDEVGAKRLPV